MRRLLGKVLPGNIIDISHLMFFILTFERHVSEGGFLEHYIHVDYFSILKGKSSIYEFLTQHKGAPEHIAFHPNCVPRPVENSFFSHLPCNATEACGSSTMMYALSWFTA